MSDKKYVYTLAFKYDYYDTNYDDVYDEYVEEKSDYMFTSDKELQIGQYVVVDCDNGLKIGIVESVSNENPSRYNEIVAIVDGRNFKLEKEMAEKHERLEKELAEMYKLAEKEMKYELYAKHNPMFDTKLKEYKQLNTKQLGG